MKKVGKILAKEMFVDYSDLQRGEEVKLDPFQKWIVPVVKIWIHELRKGERRKLNMVEEERLYRQKKGRKKETY